MSKTAKTILAVVLLLVVVAAAVGAYFQWGPPAQKRAAEAQRQEAQVTANTEEEGASAEKAETEETSAETAGETEAETARITITFTVVHGDGTQKDFTISTDAVTLREALDQEKLIEGEDRGGFFMVLTVDGETADESIQQWWCLTKDGEMSMTGVDDTVIADGEHYAFTLTTGW